MEKKLLDNVWCIQTIPKNGKSILAAVASSEEKAKEIQLILKKYQKTKVSSNIVEIPTNLTREGKIVSTVNNDKGEYPKVWCYTIESKNGSSYIAGVSTEVGFCDIMEKSIMKNCKENEFIHVDTFELDRIPFLELEHKVNDKYNIHEIDDEMQRKFRLFANSERPKIETECYGHEFEIYVNTKDHTIDSAYIDNKEIYCAYHGKMGLENIAGLATLKMCELLKEEGRYEPTMYNFDDIDTEKPLISSLSDEKFWDAGICKDIDWNADYVYDPIVKPDEMER